MSNIGNTSSSSIPIVLSKYLDKISKNKKILLIGFGGGLSWVFCSKVRKENVSKFISITILSYWNIIYISVKRFVITRHSRMGNIFGILGMLLAVIVTFLSIDILFKNLILFIITLSIGGAIGSFIVYRIPMTAMPQLVAGFHSLVGLAAVLVAISAYYSPVSFQLVIFKILR